MESKLVSDLALQWGDGETPKSPTPSYTEIFYKYLPYYLSIGMPYELYWEGDVCLVKSYREAEELRQRVKNQELWLQGLYVYEALCDVSPVLRAFAKKGTKPTPYSAEPYAISEKQRREKAVREEQLRFEKQKAKMAMWAAKANAQFHLRTTEEG